MYQRQNVGLLRKFFVSRPLTFLGERGWVAATFLRRVPMIRLLKWVPVVLALAFLVGLTTPVMAAETQGKIKSVTADKNQFVMTDNDGKDWTFDMKEKAKISVDDKEVKLEDLKAGDKVTVTYGKEGEKLIAKEVRAKR